MLLPYGLGDTFSEAARFDKKADANLASQLASCYTRLAAGKLCLIIPTIPFYLYTIHYTWFDIRLISGGFGTASTEPHTNSAEWLTFKKGFLEKL